MMMKFSIYFAVIILVTVISVPTLILAQTWAEPNCNPTTDPAACNTAAPLNVSSSAQTKAGALTITGAVTGSSTLSIVGATSLSSTLSVTGTSTLSTLVVNGTSSTFNSQANFNNGVEIPSRLNYTGTAANLAFTPSSIEDSDVSNTLTASMFQGTGSSTNAVDLATSEVSGILPSSAVTDAWVNTTGDTMTGALTITPSSAVDGLTITPNSTQEAIYISGTSGQPLMNLYQSGSSGQGLSVTMNTGTAARGVNVYVDPGSSSKAVYIESDSTTGSAYVLDVRSDGSATRTINVTNVASASYGIIASTTGATSTAIRGNGITYGVYGYANDSGTSAGVYGGALQAYGGYFTSAGTAATALYAGLSSAATTAASKAIEGAGKNGYGGYFTSTGTGTTLYAEDSGGGTALSLVGTGDHVAEITSTTNATDGLNISTEGVGVNITTSTTTADATGIVISALGGQKGIVIDATSTGIDVDTTSGYAIEANDDGIHSEAGFFGGQVFPAAGTTQEITPNIYPDLIETVTVGGGSSGLYTNGLIYDGSDIWTASYQHGSVANSLAVQRMNAYNGNETAEYTSAYLSGYSPGAMVYAFNAIYAFSSSSVTNEYLRMYQYSDSATSGTLSTAVSVRSAVSDGTNIWLGTTNRIYTMTSGGTLTLVKTGVGAIVDMIFVNGYIWALDQDNEVVYQIDSDSGTTVDTVTVGSTPVDMEFDGANFWVSNGGTATLTHILASDGSTDTINQSPTWSDVGALAFDGVNLWVMDGDTLYGYNIASSSLGDSLTLSDSSYNDMVFDGSYLWIANDTEVNKVGIGRGHGYSMPAYPRGVMLYGSDDQYHCIYFDSAGTMQDSTTLTQCL